MITKKMMRESIKQHRLLWEEYIDLFFECEYSTFQALLIKIQDARKVEEYIEHSKIITTLPIPMYDGKNLIKEDIYRMNVKKLKILLKTYRDTIKIFQKRVHYLNEYAEKIVKGGLEYLNGDKVELYIFIPRNMIKESILDIYGKNLLFLFSMEYITDKYTYCFVYSDHAEEITLSERVF